MTVGFRYVEPQYLKAALRGEFYLRRLDFYRSHECPPGRRDELEGAVEAHIDYWKIDRPTATDNQVLAQMGFNLGATSMDTTFRNIVSSRAMPSTFLLSFTDGPNDDLTSEGRSTLLRVKSLEELGLRLRRWHTRLLGIPKIGRVAYGDRRYDPRAAFLSPDPFIKESRFSGERELRIVWRALMPVPPTLTTWCPEATELIELVKS